ncbi:MAG TPA: hypothetical protein VMA35_08215 [Candidatus Sulfopaludibacter sp.]|nr:hypothetical protein [Candidatus Sulfopaludibacter sp.]
MSLNRLLSVVPFVGRLVPRRDSDRPATASAFMIFFSLNLLAAVWGLMLLVSVAALVVFALFAPGVAFFGSAEARDAEIQSINSLNDVGVLQHKAAFDVSQGYINGANATWLCHVAVDTLLFLMIGSIAGLLLVRWIKKHLTTSEDDNDIVPGEREMLKAKG